MIHYHGTPLSGSRHDAHRFLAGRHALVPFPRQDDMAAICDSQGRPACRLHGLRMLDPRVFSRLPLASADSTNAAVNGGSVTRFGMCPATSAAMRAATIADRIEAHNSAAIWLPANDNGQAEFSLG